MSLAPRDASGISVSVCHGPKFHSATRGTKQRRREGLAGQAAVATEQDARGWQDDTGEVTQRLTTAVALAATNEKEEEGRFH